MARGFVTAVLLGALLAGCRPDPAAGTDCHAKKFEHGSHCGQTKISARCGVTCDPGYGFGVGAHQVKCSKNFTSVTGTWGPNQPCTPQPCTAAESRPILHSNRSAAGAACFKGQLTQAKTGQTCPVQCDTGYGIHDPTAALGWKYPRSGVITCQPNPHVFSTLTCTAVPCSPKTIAHSDRKTAATACNARTGETCQVECDAGYLSNGQHAVQTTCQPSHEFAALAACELVSCVKPDPLLHGSFTGGGGSYPGTAITVTCVAGHIIDGADATNGCSDATNSNTKTVCSCRATGTYAPVRCEPVSCVKPDPLLHGSFTGGGGSYPGTAITVTCGAGHIIDGAGPGKNQCSVAEGDTKTATCPCLTTGRYARVDCLDSQCFKCPPGKECPAEKDSACKPEDCVACQPGFWTKGYGAPCEECRHPNVIENLDRSTCEACPPGQGPSSSYTGCISCTGAQYSPSGECFECLSPNIVEGSFTICRACHPGEAPNADRTACSLCELGHWSPGFGVQCTECRHPSVIKSPDRSTCGPCSPGQGPDETFTACGFCQAKQYSTYGSCQKCPGAQIPDVNQTSCRDPYKCPAGMECKTGLCENMATCSECSPGWVSASPGTTCTQCVEQWVANTKKTDCIKCDPGQQPTANQGGCTPCSNGTQYSEDGYECKGCPAPYVIAKCDRSVCTKDHTRCSACPPGKGPAKNRTDCTSCIGNTVSQLDNPTCNECGPGKVPNDAHTSCVACPHHEDNVGDGTCGCAPNFYNASARTLVCFSYGYNQAELNAVVGDVMISEPCQECPRCADCIKGSITVKAGWRMIPESDSSPLKQVGMAFACDMTDAGDQYNQKFAVAQARCPGTKLIHGHTDFGGCAENYTGYMCNSCEKDYHRPAITGLCESCASAGLRNRIIFGCLGLSALLVATIVAAWWNRRAIQIKSHQIRTLIKRVSPAATRDNDELAEPLQESDGTLQAHLNRQPESVSQSGRKKTWSRQWALLMACLSTPVRIFVTYVQVVGQLTGKSGALSVKYPKLFTGALQYFAPVVDASRWLGEIFSADCNGMSSFRAKWFLKVVGLPLLLVSLVLALYLSERCVHSGLRDVDRAAAHQQIREALMQRMFFAVFLSYPPVCNTVFSSFNCVDVTAGSAQQILIDDDRVYCGDQVHQNIQKLSYLIIFVVAIGVPMCSGLWIASRAQKYERSKRNPAQHLLTPVDAHRESQSPETLAMCAVADNWGEPLANSQLTPGDQDLEEMEAVIRDVTVLSDFSILIGAYRPSVAYWETVDMLRKLALVGLVVLVGRGSVAQVAAGTVLSFGFFALHIKVREHHCC